MKNFFGHLHMVNKHRFMVLRLCTRCGLFWRGLVHDLSKYSPFEFFESVKYYQGNRSPLGACRRATGYSKAWLHHKGRNKHHPEYWYDAENAVQMNMPYKYAVECLCDKIAAAKCYNKKGFTYEKALNHWLKFKEYTKINEKTINFFTKILTDLTEKSEKEILNKKYLKNTYKIIVEN